LLEEAVALFASGQNKARIAIDINTELPAVLGSENDMHILINNLLSNAIKYSPNGGRIVLGARGEDNGVTLWVKDEGGGIPLEAQDKIFDRFYRVDNTACRMTGGTGLGLALVKEIVQEHGGRVWVESVVGEGSTFYVSLPAA
jgi:signal transduction histidine kinase